MLKFIDRVVVNFAPLSERSRSARTLLYLMTADKHKAANPKAQIVVNQKDSITRPIIEITYRDKKHLSIPSSNYSAAELTSMINKYSKKLQLEEDITSAS
ncbi:hypothetical protein BC829DRAFT_399280 [Chytridium lagenaria]|nr:hypothetical protein BC829DRAFT_399280 [Chytridium lagenaria]